MNKDFKTYRLTTLALLVVLGINVVMPASVLAAGLYCQVESDVPANPVTPAVNCCLDSKFNGIAALSSEPDLEDYCPVMRACSQSISESLTEFEGLPPIEKQNTLLPAFSASHHTHPGIDARRKPVSQISLDASFPHPTPPVFLMNSTFLN